jgi:hypothetical protein
MDDKERQSAFMSALVTEHFVLQTAANGTVNEVGARASLYILSLSTSLVAMGFASQSHDVFVPFVATVLPALFLLGVFTVVRLVDANLEYMQFLTNIARIRSYYRTLASEATVYFAAQRGRWPEAGSTPALGLGSLVGFLTTTPSMVAFLNSIVAGAGVTLLAGNLSVGDPAMPAVSFGVAVAVLSMTTFLLYQRWRYSICSPSEVRSQEIGDAGELAPSTLADE